MKPRGLALPVGLLLLAALSLLALTSASGTSLQRNMASNFQDRGLALNNAEAAAAWARAWLESRPDIDRESGCESGCVLPTGIRPSGELSDQPEFKSAAWWAANAIPAGYDPETAEPGDSADTGIEPARWIIEEFHYEPLDENDGNGSPGAVAWYRVLSRGTGLNPRSVAVTETIMTRPWEGVFETGEWPPRGPPGSFCGQFDELVECGVKAWRQRR